MAIGLTLKKVIENVSPLPRVSNSKTDRNDAIPTEVQALTDLVPLLVWTADAKGYITYANAQVLELLGATQDKTLGKQWLSILHPDDRDHALQAWIRSVQTGEPFELEYRVLVKSGEYISLLNRARAVRNKKTGEIEKWVGVSIDLTESVRIANALKESEAKFKTLSNSVPALVWSALTDGTVDYYNDRVFEYEGAQNVNGKWEWATLIHSEDIEKTIIAWTTALKTGIEYSCEHRVKMKSGEFRWHLSRGKPLMDEKGQIVRWFGSSTDIHDQKLTEVAMRKAKEEAEKASTLKSTFLANMSHEIRTPLGAMLGFAELLRDPDLKAEDKQNYTNILMRNGEQLSLIINDILDLSKVESGHLKFEIEKISPRLLMSEVVSLFKVKALEKGLSFDYVCDDSTPLTISSDAMRVRQILTNLVGNALKFTQSGSVKIKSYGTKTCDGKIVSCFEISDTGVGISSDQHEKIFEMFVQGDESITRRFGGTGLGLALSRKLARALEGEVNLVSSKLGSGTTFKVMISDCPEKVKIPSQAKLALNVHASAASDSSMSLQGVRVLIVDDAEDNQRLIMRYLTKQGANAMSASNGIEACRMALAGEFDVVLMDIQMPEMDGYTATETLRSAGYNKPIIALTAHAMSEAKNKCLDVGCTDYLPKPINSRDLIETVAKHIENRP